eukprot:CAMPEP_0197852972 /NCGR_PEP_ID=MMETSP1438-20131217/21861_1 /TAXON_ID=1461541 /ORGANISM="Pterosperma sp., Strain CCMP1384" /LENGTH=156 /DNA_ID=CAMNT_0043467227 /DNA_START=194 /DNA_END=661 /DNA_ORIENTATION=+
MDTDFDMEDDANYEPNGPQEPTSENWEEFWQSSTARNAEAMREAGKDPNAPYKKTLNKYGQEIKAGMPKDSKLLCCGCGIPVSLQYECCQCLEIFRDRALRTANDDWERTFWCSGDCYKAHWEEHKHKHGPSKAGPSKMDSRIHEFEAAKGYGALW